MVRNYVTLNTRPKRINLVFGATVFKTLGRVGSVFFSFLRIETSNIKIPTKNKRDQRALCRSPEEKVKGNSGAIYRGPLMFSTNIGTGPVL